MNKIIIFSLLTLSAIPFAFWKMETEFSNKFYGLAHTTNNMGSRNCNFNSMIIQNEIVHANCGFKSIFTNNNKVNYHILCLIKCPRESKKSYLDLFITNNASAFHKNDSILFVLYEGPLNMEIIFLPSVSVEEQNSYNLNFIDKIDIDELFLKETVVRLSTDFKTSSGILVSNQKGYVEISQEGEKPQEFQKVLQNYFDINNRNTRLVENLQSSSPFSARLINSLQFRPTSEQIDLLNSSKILSVFGVFKKRGTESIIWGVAKDNQTGKLYPWITDLKTDLSFLMEK